MKKSKKLISLVVAAVMALGIVMAPMAAVAKDSPTIGKLNIGVFKITSVKGKTIRLVGTTSKGKKAKSITIVSKYKLDKRYYKVFRTDNYTVTRIAKGAFKGTKAAKVILPATTKKIDAGAFKGAKAKTIVIKAKISPAAAKGMLTGSKVKSVTIKVPSSKVKAWKAKAKVKNYFGKGIKVTIK